MMNCIFNKQKKNSTCWLKTLFLERVDIIFQNNKVKHPKCLDFQLFHFFKIVRSFNEINLKINAEANRKFSETVR